MSLLWDARLIRANIPREQCDLTYVVSWQYYLECVDLVVLETGVRHWLADTSISLLIFMVGLEFNHPVNTIRVMSSRSTLPHFSWAGLVIGELEKHCELALLDSMHG